MGQPASQNPFAPESASNNPFTHPSTATEEKPKSPAEKKEAPKKSLASLADYRARARKIESEPNKDAADSIRQLRGSKTTAEQLEGLTALNQALVSVLSKLAKKGVDISKIRTTEQLKREIAMNGIQLDIPEAAAVENLDRIASEPGETSSEIKKSWPETITTAQEGGKGMGEKYMGYLKKDPVGTIALTLVGVAGIYLTYQGIKALAGKAFGAGSKGKDKSSSWFKKEIAIPVAIMAAGAFLGKDVVAKMLAEAGLDYFGVEDKVKKGQEFTEEEKRKLTSAGEKIRQKVEEEKKTKREGASASAEPAKEETGTTPVPEGADKGELVVDGERLTGNEIEKRARYGAITQALTQIYCVDAEQFIGIRGEFSTAFELLRGADVGKVVEAYDRAKTKKSDTISFKELGLSTNSDVSEKALYHVCAIISTAFKEATQINKTKPSPKDTVETFISHLGNDPALEISDAIQSEIGSKIGELKITSLGELHDSAEKVFNTEVIDEVFKKEKNRFIEYLANKYNIDLKGFDSAEKASFIAFVGLLYARPQKINLSDETIDTVAGYNTLSPKVQKVSKEFFIALKKDVTGLVDNCIARYDIKRTDEPEYNEILKKHLKLDMLFFRDGMQMALLSDGINFDETSDFESVGQAKDITMLYLMVHILKQRSSHDVYSHYLSNLIDLGSKSKIDLKLNLNFKRLQPYFEQLFGILMRNSKNWLVDTFTKIKGLEDTNKDPNKIERLAGLTTAEFLLDTSRSGVRAALDIPIDLVMTVMGNFPEKIPANTTGEQFLKIVLSLGGSISFPVEQQGAGLVYLFGKYYFIKPTGIAIDTLMAVIQKGPGVAAKTYVLGASPFVVIYGGWGVAKGLATYHTVGWRAIFAPLQGVGKGLAAPVSMPYTGSLHIRTAYRGAKYSYNVIRGRTVANAEMSAKYFIHYNNLVKNASSGKFQKLKAWKERPGIQIRKLFFQDINNEMRLAWAHYFSVNFNDFYGLNPELPIPEDAPTGKTLQAIAYKNKMFYDGDDFRPMVLRFQEVIGKMRQIDGLETLNEEDMFRKFKEVGLENTELNTLRQRIRVEFKGNFESFRKSLAKDLKISAGEAGPGLLSRIRGRFRRAPAAGEGTGEGAPGTEPVPEKPVRILGKELKYRYRGEEIELTQAEIEDMRKAGISQDEAIAKLCEQKYAAAHPTSEPSAAPAEAGTAPKPAETAEGGRAGRLRRAGQHLLGETLASAGGAEKALTDAEKNLDAVRKKIAAAEKTLQEIEDARRAGTIVGDVEKVQAQIDAARQIIEDGKRAEAELEAFTRALQSVGQTETALKAAKTATGVGDVAKLERELRAVTEAAESAMKSSGRAMEAMTKLGKAGRYLKPGLRIAGAGLGAAGAAFSAYSAVSSGWEAITTDVQGRGAIKGSEAGMWTVNTVADTAAVATMLGAEGAGVTFASALAAPLAPLTYAGSEVFETLNEDTRTSAEWIQGNPYEVLNHFYTSLNACSIGNAWLSMGRKAAEGRLEKQQETMHRMFRGLVAIQKDPSLLAYISDPNVKPSGEKNAEIERRIAANYTAYHEYYFRNTVASGVQSYGTAEQLVLDAQMYDDIMQRRDEAKKKHEPFILISNDKQSFSLHLDRYDVLGGIEDPRARVVYNPSHVVQAYKETMVRIFERDPIRKGNLDQMNSAYLIRLYRQICLALGDPTMKAKIESEEGLKEDLARQAESISGYLKTARGVNMMFALQDSSYREPRMSLEEIGKYIEGIGSFDNEAYRKFEEENYHMTPSVQAMYRLGEYFGYAGQPTEKGLKDFFNKTAASYHGIYWDGSQWMLQERGMEFDDSFGPDLTSSMIEKIIGRMRERTWAWVPWVGNLKQADNILEHRSDSVFLDAYDYTSEVEKMAKILEGGLAEGGQRGYQGRQEGEKEKGAHVGYTQPKENLTKNYEQAIEYTKKQGNWTHLDYTINNVNSITLKRKDGNATIELTRTGETWKVGNDYKAGLTLMQAVTLGNLINWAKQWVGKENIKGNIARPFAIDGDAIDFDVAWNPIDRNFLEKWIGFYDEIGVSKEMAVDTLNNWFEKEGPKG